MGYARVNWGRIQKTFKSRVPKIKFRQPEGRNKKQSKILGNALCDGKHFHLVLNEILDEFNSCGYSLQDNFLDRLRDMDYATFLKTSYWRAIKEYCHKRAYSECEACGSKDNIEVHHMTYKHARRELFYLDDLIVLCRRCHAEAHKKSLHESH